jgi:replication factor C small subunit
MKQHTLWIEKYRSETLEQYIGNDAVKTRIADCIASNDIPHFIFAGSAGTGKTTLAKLIVKNIQCDYLYINASDENGIDIIRDKVKGFASTSTFKPLKVVILDEADFLTQPAQAALRNLIEEYSMVTRFVLTCNYIERLIEPLQSRCEIHILKPPTKSAVAKHICTNILDVEGVTYDIKDVAAIINSSYPDIRRAINAAQGSVRDGKLQLDKASAIQANYMTEILEVLKNPKDKKGGFTKIRQIIADSKVKDFTPLYRFMYDSIDEYATGTIASVILIIAETQYQDAAVVDKEINVMSMFVKLMAEL